MLVSFVILDLPCRWFSEVGGGYLSALISISLRLPACLLDIEDWAHSHTTDPFGKLPFVAPSHNSQFLISDMIPGK